MNGSVRGESYFIFILLAYAQLCTTGGRITISLLML